MGRDGRLRILRLRDHDLPDVLRLGHVAERVRGRGQRELPAAQRPQAARRELLEQALQHLAQQLGRDLAEVDGEVRNVFPGQRHLLAAPDPCLPDLEETATAPEHSEALRDEVAGEGVEHEVYALPARQLHHVIGEGERAGVHEMAHPERTEVGSLLVASRRGEHLRPGALRELHRGQTYASRRGVDEHALPGLHSSQSVQRVFRGEEGDRDCSGLGKAHPFRLGRQELRPGRHERPEGAVGHPHDRLADLQTLDTLAHRHDRAGALAAERRGRPLVEAHRVQHVTEVQTAG